MTQTLDRAPTCFATKLTGASIYPQGREQWMTTITFAPSLTGIQQGTWISYLSAHSDLSVSPESANIRTFYRNINDDAIFGKRFEGSLFHSSLPLWSPVAAYIDRAKRPHVMFTMRHDFQPMGEELLRGDALAITAAIITRFDKFRSTGHAYVPVLVLSFFGNLCGRILQAYFNGTNLVIWKTNIYHFTPENASKWFGVFMQQMTGFPVGDTKTLEPHPHPHPHPQQKAPSSFSSSPLR